MMASPLEIDRRGRQSRPATAPTANAPFRLPSRLARLANIRALLYPSQRRELRTALSAIEGERALAYEVENREWIDRFGYKRKTFEGTLGNGAFDIQRSVARQNAVLPRIRGTIRDEPFGASIFIEISLSPVLLLLLPFLLCTFAIPLFAASSQFSARLFSLFCVWLLWTMTSSAFRHEAARARRELIRILDATLELEPF